MNLKAVLRVNNSLSDRVAALLLASQLTIVNLDINSAGLTYLYNKYLFISYQHLRACSQTPTALACLHVNQSVTKFIKIDIGSASLLIWPYKVLPFTKRFTPQSFFSFIFIVHFLWACRSLREPQKKFFKFSFCTFTCLSNNSLISSWISAKFVSALLPCMYALPVILFSA